VGYGSINEPGVYGFRFMRDYGSVTFVNRPAVVICINQAL